MFFSLGKSVSSFRLLVILVFSLSLTFTFSRATLNRPLKVLSVRQSSNTRVEATEAVLDQLAFQYSKQESPVSPTGSDDTLYIVAASLPNTLLTEYVHADSASNSYITYIAGSTDGSTNIEAWSPNTYFTSVDPATEMLGLLTYALREINPLKLAFVYVNDVGNALGPAVYQEFLRRTTALARSDDVVAYDATAYSANTTAYDAFVEQLGGATACVFVFGPAGDDTTALVRALLSDSRVVGSVLVPSWLMDTAVAQYGDLASGTNAASLREPSKVLLSSSNPHPQDSRWAAMAAYITDMGENYDPNSHWKTPTGIQTIAGWIAGVVAKQGLQASVQSQKITSGRLTSGTVRSQADYQAWLFSQRTYTVGSDIVVGPFGADCSGSACRGAPYVTRCNVGGRMVLVHSLAKLTDSGGTTYYGLNTIATADMLLRASECRAADVALNVSRLLQVGFLNYAAPVSLSGNYLSSHLVKLAQIGSAFSFKWRPLPMSGSDTAAVVSVLAAQPVAALTGPVPMTLADTGASTALLVEPVYMGATPYQNYSNVVYLTPTIEQQWGAAARMVAQSQTTCERDCIGLDVVGFLICIFNCWLTPGSTGTGTKYNFISAAMRSTASATSTELIADALIAVKREGMDFVETVELNDKTGISNIRGDGVVFCAGLVESDVAKLASRLNSKLNLRVVVLFDEFTQFYDTFYSTFSLQSTSVRQRLLFVTNLPPWSASGASALTTSFLAAVTNTAYQTPAGLRAYLAARVLQQLSSGIASPTRNDLENALYDAKVLEVDDLQLGPFQRTNCAYDLDTNAFQCTEFNNAGAGALYVWSFQRVMDATTAYAGGPYAPLSHGGSSSSSKDPQKPDTTSTTPEPTSTTKTTTTTTTEEPTEAPTTRPPTTAPSSNDRGPASSSKTTTIVAVVVVCACVVVLGVVALLLWLCCRGDSRDNRNAPKDDTQPVTLMFTDIESSTALWAMAPQAMAAAMAQHHSMVRELIVRYKCYEVKTIGDSFMIATADPFAAVQLARDVQLNFLHADWGSTTIDDTYAALGKSCAAGTTGTGTGTGSTSGSGGGDALDGGKAAATPAAAPWNGLRVRIGVHRGMAEVRLDEVTKGYDYYGDTVNTAARTESAGCGGQVLCTASVVDALTPEQRDSVTLAAAGARRLRGVTEPVQMYELRVVDGRVFANSAADANPLAALGDAGGAADVAAGVGDAGDDSDDDASSHEPSNVGQVAEVLDVYFSAYSDRQKIKLLQRTCKYFSLPTPPRKVFASDAAYLHALIQTVAARTSAVIDFKRRLQEATNEEALVSATAAGGQEEGTSEMPSKHSSQRHSSVFFSSTNTQPNSDSKHRRSLVIGRPSNHGSEETIVLVLNSGELLTLRKGSDVHDKAESSVTVHNDPFSSVPEVEEPCLAAPRYLNGRPSVSGDKVSACFEEANGLLFRVIDTAAERWAFYNDTTDFVMHVHFSVDQSSMVQWGPHVSGRVKFIAATGCYEGELLIDPLCTEVLLTGNVVGYGMRYSATVADGDE